MSLGYNENVNISSMINPHFLSEQAEYALYNADCLEVLPLLPNNTFQTIFADPPYFLSKGGFISKDGNWINNFKGEWDKAISQEEMDEFNSKWLELCKDKLKENGTIWICGTYHNIFSVERALKKCGYKIINIITWQKTNPQPSLTSGHFQYSTELIIWAKNAISKHHLFNEDEIKKINFGKEMTDVWSIPAVKDWEKEFGKHSTQKPLALLYRILLSSTNAGDYVLDPFSGSSTTGVASLLLKRKFIGIEKSSEYYNLSIKRMADAENTDKQEFFKRKIFENADSLTVIINTVRNDVFDNSIEKGISYFRIGDSAGSLLVVPGFEKLGYVMFCSEGREPQLFKLKKRGFRIWSAEELRGKGFSPSHSKFYAVLFFDNNSPIPCVLTDYVKQKIRGGIKELLPVSLVLKKKYP